MALAEHVALGQSLGLMQVCHGKAALLRRLTPGDRIIYYSLVSCFRAKDRLQAFTGIGTVADAILYQVETAPGFTPWRREMHLRAALADGEHIGS